MRKIHVFGFAVFAVFAFSVMVAASASAATAEWLAGKEEAITAALASETTGSLTLGNPNGLGLKVSVKALCTGVFVGTVGPSKEDSTTEVLNAAKTSSTISCTDVENCETAEASAVNLPWLTELIESEVAKKMVVLDVIFSGGKGEPGWKVTCTEPLVGKVSETCEGTASIHGSSVLENDAAESDVLGTFIKAENNKFLCSGSKTEEGFTTTEEDGAGLVFLTGGEALSVNL